MRILLSLSFAIAISFGPPAVAGALVNPGFDSDLSGWDIFGAAVWDALDADGSGSSFGDRFETPE